MRGFSHLAAHNVLTILHERSITMAARCHQRTTLYMITNYKSIERSVALLNHMGMILPDNDYFGIMELADRCRLILGTDYLGHARYFIAEISFKVRD